MRILAHPRLLRTSLLFAFLAIATLSVFSQESEDLNRAQLHYERGRKLYRSGLYEQAIEELYTALSVREVFFDAQLLLGRSLIETKRYREAVATLRGMEPRQQARAEVQKLLGKAFYEINRLREASHSLNYAIILSKRPDHELHYLLSLVQLRRRDFENALEEAKTAISLNPRNRPAHKALSDAYLMKGDFLRAEKALKRYLLKERDPREAAKGKEQIEAIKSLGRAKLEKSVQKPMSLPLIYDIPKPDYTAEALRNKVEGTAKVEVLFESDGVIRRALVTRGLGFGLDEEALRTAKRIKFKPGEVDGQPISMWIGVQLVFSIVSEREKRREDVRIVRAEFLKSRLFHFCTGGR